MKLGIDFGTTRTVVAAVRKGRYPVATFETDRGFQNFLPGLASLSDGRLRLGSEVETTTRVPLLRSVKAEISGAAPDEPVRALPGADLSALELATKYLVYLREMLLHASNLDVDPEEPLEAMVAVPANASTRQRYLTMEAFGRAGFHVVGLLNEPTAGAIEFARHALSALSTRSPKKYVLVYDLGGGTFDAAAVSLENRRFELLATDGISSLGGNDFDEIILDELLSEKRILRGDIDQETTAHLLERCRVGKEGLTPTSKRLLVDTTGLLDEDQIIVDLGAIYERATPLVERTLASLDLLLDELRRHGIDPDNPRELGAVYLVGGSVQFPLVQRLLRAKFGRKIQLSPEPHAATAVGLAIALDPEAEVYVREAPTRHFGVWREGDGGREKIFDPIIVKQQGMSGDGPVVVKRRYHPAHSVGRLRFVECTSLDDRGQPQGEVTPWESVLFPYERALVGRDDLDGLVGQRSFERPEEIEETYEYLSTGLIKVEIRNLSHDYGKTYVLGAPTL